ncbi:conserved hypothetical protein [Neospora caninum Liverpool]|uniref:Methyltransferase domain protein n=1 Tax=Neospora caninum (strain Liverpool) TaxID=572307 RepID=F0VEE9_NEOCL|nr:conserved hypothetical protein [Neospora caninum Liverpool]CBZ52093.1 conserved hypothetical protein [Neospora caninum Liverpool]|eukprot:XP_003882125.1 conserved hypothetical protein [Neospora caninum Liverpool]
MDPSVSPRVPTPDTSHVGLQKAFPDVYEAAEDSFLFLDALAEDIRFLLRRRPALVLEMGSGSGCVISFLRKLFLLRVASSKGLPGETPTGGQTGPERNARCSGHPDTAHDSSHSTSSCSSSCSPSPSSSCSFFVPRFLAVDCNLSATAATLETARRAERNERREREGGERPSEGGEAPNRGAIGSASASQEENENCRGAIDVLAGDLFGGFRSQSRREPPWSPSSACSPSLGEAQKPGRTVGIFDVILFNPPYVPGSPRGRPPSPADWAWWGGEDGREVIDRFLPQAIAYLSPSGVLYLLLEKRNKVDEVVAHIEAQGFAAEVRFPWEGVFVEPS